MKMRWFGVALVLVTVCAAAQGQAGPASGKRPMTFQDLMAMKRVSDPQISPSGKWVMFSVMDVSLEKNTKVNHLWVVRLNGSGGETQVTFGDGESNGRFSPDGKWVSISMKDQIYLAPWDEAAGKVGAAVQLTRVSGGADGAIWSPDSKRLMFVADVYPECSDKPTWDEEDACDKAKDDAAAASPVKGQVWDALLYRHWDHFTGLKRSHVLVVSASDGNAVRDLTPASVVGNVEVPTYFVGGAQDYVWAPDSKEIAYVAKLDPVPAASTNNDVFTLRLDEPGAKAVKVSTSPGSDDEPEYSPDGKYLAFRSQARDGFESDKFRLLLFDRGAKAIRQLMPKFDLWVDEFVWDNDPSYIYFVAGDQGAETVFLANISGDTVSKLGKGGGEWSDIKPVKSSGPPHFIGSRMWADRPMEIDYADAMMLNGSVSVTTSTLINPSQPVATKAVPVNGPGELQPVIKTTQLVATDLSSLEPFWFDGAEGTKVEGLLRPPGFDPAKKYPVKFLMHGGPQTAWGDAWSFRWNWELMASSGYVVVGINRRGSTGYGQKFVDEVSGDWGGRAYEDLMKGLDYAEAHYSFMDKTRECALGASYGGFMADWVLTHTNRFKCIVTHDGMYDPVSAWGDTEEMWFNEWEFRRPEDFPKGWDGFT